MLDIPVAPVTDISSDCVLEAAKRFSLPAKLIYAVLAVEGGKPGTVSKNTNGTYDLGPMQINSIWLKKFSGYITASQLVYNGCINVQVGAWILRSNINGAGNFWQGVGNYHSRTPQRNIWYQKKIYNAVNGN